MQENRKQRLGEGAGGRSIDMEVGILARAFGTKWSIWWPKLKPLDKSSKIGKRITAADELFILETAAKEQSPYLYTYLTVQLARRDAPPAMASLRARAFAPRKLCACRKVKKQKRRTSRSSDGSTLMGGDGSLLGVVHVRGRRPTARLVCVSMGKPQKG